MKDDYTIVNGELYHYGVPGMKWGHKRGTKQSEKPNQSSKPKSSKGRKIAAGVLAGIGAVGVAAIAAKVTNQRKTAVQNTIQKMMKNTKPKRAVYLPYYGRQWNMIQKEMAKARRNASWTK